MKENIISIFVEAAEGVLETEIKAGVQRCTQPSLITLKDTPQEITILTEISEKLQGAVLYGMSQDVALKIAAAMSGETIKELDGMARSALTEFGNMITGNATMALERDGFAVKLSPPVFVFGKGQPLPWKRASDNPFAAVILSTTLGEIEIFESLHARLA